MRRFLLPAAILAVLVVIGIAAWPKGPDDSGTASAHDFSLPRLGGSGRIDLTHYRGKPVVVDLFASWCTACESELPVLAAASKRLQGKVTFIGVDSGDTGDGLAMARRLGINGWPLASDIGATQSDYHDALGHQGMPVAAFYSASGELLGTDDFALTEQALADKLRQYFDIK
jgi:thiol-disulfide isomerase/thioredoxin